MRGNFPAKLLYNMLKQSDSFLFVEKYRPTTLEKCILPKSVKTEISAYLKSGEISNMIFSGSAGVGKTSVAKAICNELDADMLYINMSNETGIDVVRNQIVQFASTASFDNSLKIVIGDEAERLSSNAQDSLKATIEAFHKTTRFIFTTNNVNKLIEPLRSRCNQFEFKIADVEKKDLMAQMIRRCIEILKSESIEFDPKAIVSLVQKYFPDFRKTLNELQRYSTYGKIDAGILVEESTDFDHLVDSMKTKKFADVRKWIARNSDIDPSVLFRYFFDNLSVLFEGKSIPNIILILAQYQNYASNVVDQEINNIACMVEIMGIAEWK
jgi:replication factor C small subunit